MNKKDLIMVTGAGSMIGKSVIEYLRNQNVTVVPLFHETVDLLEREELESFMLDFNSISGVIHLAGYNGGIEWNRLYPADIFYKTAMMALNVLNVSQRFGVKKVMSVMASCSYPDLGNTVLSEEQLWDGPCNPSVECHGLSKRILDAYGRQINKQYEMKCINAIMTNSYGPCDSYHPQKTKVVGAMIKKFVEAKEQGLQSLEFWGTGKPLRELIYCKDAGKVISELFFTYEDSEPINIGSDQETSIKSLAQIIADEVGYKGEIIWDTSKKDGQMRKKLDTTKMKNVLPDFRPTSIKDGIKETVEWYNQEVSHICKR